MQEESKRKAVSKRRRWILAAATVLVAGGAIGCAIYYFLPPYHFAEVDPGVLYRSGQLGYRDLERVYEKVKIRTIVDLCQEKRDTTPALEERQFARDKGIRHVHLAVPHGMIDADKEIQQFLQILDDPKNRPVLVHCWKGIKRTGCMVAIYKMEFHGLDNEQAMAQLPAFGREVEDFQESEKDCVKSYVPRRKRGPAEPPPDQQPQTPPPPRPPQEPAR